MIYAILLYVMNYFVILHQGKISIIFMATKEEIDHFLTNLFGKLDKTGFFKIPERKLIMQQNITNIFMRINNLSTPEVQTLQGIIKLLNQ